MSESKPLYYADYLRLDRLLDAQFPESAKRGGLVHDEMLFIIVHQVYELWFKQILFELDAVLEVFRGSRVAEKDVGRCVGHLRRIVEIQRLLIRQVDVLETMTPLDFLDFRDQLVPASGFQSVQFRLIENRLGVAPRNRLKIRGAPYTAPLSQADRETLEASERQPSLLELLNDWLERTPFLTFGGFDFWREYRRAVEALLEKDRLRIQGEVGLGEAERSDLLSRWEDTVTHFDALLDRDKHERLVDQGKRRLSHDATLAALLINLYRDEPILHLPFQFLTHLMDVDEAFTTWRYRHALMASRMIGTRLGTGGTAGTYYLRKAADRYKVYGDLFNLATFLIPRSALPKLPPEVERTMSFTFTGESE